MARTRRKQPTSRDARYERLEREWNQKVKTTSPPSRAVLPPQVEAVRREAEALANRPLAEKRGPIAYSVQEPATDYPAEVGGGLVWWTGGKLSDYIPIAQYGDPQRVKDIRAFALVSPFILNAEAVLTKKVQSLQWTIEGGRNLAQKWQRRLNNFENGDGWDFFIARWIRAFSESDKMACAELIRSAPSWAIRINDMGMPVLTPRGERAMEQGKDKVWEIVDARVMDPMNCYPTTSKEFPLVYKNSYTGERHRMRTYQFMSLIDLPAVDDRFPGHGVCAVSRAIWAAQEDRMVTRFVMEKISENPGAGIGIINTSVTALETALKDASSQREARGVVYYKGVIFLPVLDPTGSTKMEFLSFADLPDGFSRTETYNIVKEIVATSFGLDILELGSIPGRLGTATQAKVAAQKGRTKSIGAIMQGVERAFRYKLLPDSLNFSIKKHDQAEEMQRAEIDQIYFENAIRYAQFAPDPTLPTQYLADKGAIPNEPPYITEDLTPLEVVSDTQSGEAVESGPEGAAEAEIVKRNGPRVRIDRDGKTTWLEVPYRLKRSHYPRITPARVDRALQHFDRLFPEYAQ